MEAAIYSKGIHNKNMSVTLIYVISSPLGWSLLSYCTMNFPPVPSWPHLSSTGHTPSPGESFLWEGPSEESGPYWEIH